MTYETLLFKNGFLLTDLPLRDFSDDSAVRVLSQWRRIDLGPYALYHDPRLPIAHHAGRKCAIFLLGTAVDPVNRLSQEKAIATKLGDLFDCHEDRFLDGLDNLNGRHVIILSTSAGVYVYPDACGMKCVFYDRHAPNVIVGSHAVLVAAGGGYTASSFAQRLISSTDYTNSHVRYLPGIATPYTEVVFLTPNTCLDVNKRLPRRFFPRMPVANRRVTTDMLDELVTLFETEVDLLYSKAKLLVSITAGMDTRTTLAATRKHSDNILYFTHVTNRPISVADAKFATRLCKQLNLKHARINVQRDVHLADYLAYRQIWLANTAGIIPDSCRVSKAYLDLLPTDFIHLKSNISEIGRAFYRKKENILPNWSAEAMAAAYGIEAHDPMVIRCFEDFIKTTDFDRACELGYDPWDFFYWEHRMMAWQGVTLLGVEPAHETIILFNNRRILTMLLSAPLEDRLEDRVHHELIRRMWPELTKFPFNPTPWGGKIKSSLRSRMPRMVKDRVKRWIKRR